MSWTFPLDTLRQLVCSSLFLEGGVYRQRGNGDREYRGSRPNDGLHGHGMFSRRCWVLVSGKLRQVKLFKQRWMQVQIQYILV